jgi:DNA-binding NarL/FixJ family response regulator
MEHKPDILLVDIGLPGMSGIDLIKKVKAKNPDLEIMVHTIFDARDTVFAAIKAGATGYILKGASPRELIESIENLAKGGAPMSPKIARAVIGEFQDVENTMHYLLTPREREILVELEKGLTYKELAEKLSISHHTIHTHIKKIYEKLHAKSRRDALNTARKKGII